MSTTKFTAFELRKALKTLFYSPGTAFSEYLHSTQICLSANLNQKEKTDIYSTKAWGMAKKMCNNASYSGHLYKAALDVSSAINMKTFL